MRARQKQADEQSKAYPLNPGTMLHTRFDRTATFSDREVVALPKYGELVQVLDQIVEHHAIASQTYDSRA